MSLEATIQENTAAIRELIAAIAKGLPVTGAQVAAVVAEAPAEVAKEKPPAPKTEAKAETPAPAEEAPKLATYEDVRKAINDLAKAKGRDAVVGVLGQFGAAKGPDVKPEQYAAFVVAAHEAIEA